MMRYFVVIGCLLISMISHLYAQYPAIEKLRESLRYKFALNFISERSQLSPEDVASLLTEDSTLVGLDTLSGMNVLESFRCPDLGIVYDWASHDGSMRYYLLTHYLVGGRGEAFLFSRDSINPQLLDSCEIGPKYQIEYLNGGLIIKSQFGSHGAGYTAEHLELTTVSEGRFKVLYHEYLSWFDVNNPKNEPRRRIAKIGFIDLNGDSTLDVDVTIREDVLSESPGNPTIYEQVLEAIPVRILGEKKIEYFWQNTTHTFKILERL